MHSKKKILIADDDTRLLQALKVRLEAEGFSVTTSQDAYQAVQLARQDPPDLLLLDINMPAGKGFSVKERLANVPELSKVPVVYVTGDTSSEVAQAAVRSGASGVVRKPFKISSLLDVVLTALAERDHERAA